MKKEIYKKSFKDILEIVEEKDSQPVEFHKTFDDLLVLLKEKTVYEISPEREANKDLFVQMAKLFSEIDQTSVEIIEFDHEIVAHFQISILMLEGNSLKVFAHLIGIADEMHYLSTGKGATLTLAFYTHEIIRDGEKVRNI